MSCFCLHMFFVSVLQHLGSWVEQSGLSVKNYTANFILTMKADKSRVKPSDMLLLNVMLQVHLNWCKQWCRVRQQQPEEKISDITYITSVCSCIMILFKSFYKYMN